MMDQGTVKFFNPDKGYGFITRQDGTDVFVHQSAIKNPSGTLAKGDRVEFVTKRGQKGLQAEDVRSL